MSGRFKSRADLETGLVFMLFGGGTALFSLEYKLGSASSMGPGYFPFVLGLLLAVIGAVIAGRSLFRTGFSEAPRVLPLKAAAIVFVSLIAFAATITTLGMVVAIPLCVTISLFASPEFRIMRALVLSLCLLGFSYLIFGLGLGIQIPIHPWS